MANEEQNMNNESLADQVANLREELWRVSEAMNEMRSKTMDHMQKKAKHLYENAKDNGAEMMGEMKDKFHNMEDQICTYTREQPMKSLAMAAAVGFLACLLTRH